MTLQELKNDPRTKGRSMFAAINCIERGITDHNTILLAIDQAYRVGRRRKPSQIKDRKKKTISFLVKRGFLS